MERQQKIHGVTGKLTVYYGCMFAGKSEECARQRRRYRVANKNVLTVTHDSETRGEKGGLLWTHHSQEIQEHPIHPLKNIENLFDFIQATGEDIHVIQIDEAQQFSERIVSVCEQLVRMGYIVQVFCLMGSFLRRPFGHCHLLLASGARVIQLTAICQFCGKSNATNSMRISEEMDETVIGGSDKYKACCINCFNKWDGHDSKKDELVHEESTTTTLAQRRKKVLELPRDESLADSWCCILLSFVFMVVFIWVSIYYDIQY